MTAVTEKPKKAAKKDTWTFESDVPDVSPAPAAEVTQAPPNPGESGFDWQAEYPDEDVFVFTAKDGTTVGLAAMGEKRRPKPGVLRKLRHQPPVEQMWYVIERVSSENALAVSDEFDDEDYSHMFEQWTEWSGTTAGESSRSSTS